MNKTKLMRVLNVSLRVMFICFKLLADLSTPFWILVDGDVLAYYFIWHRIDDNIITIRTIFSLSRTFGKFSVFVFPLFTGSKLIHTIIKMRRKMIDDYDLVDYYQDLTIVFLLLLQDIVFYIFREGGENLIFRGWLFRLTVFLYFIQTYSPDAYLCMSILLSVVLHLLPIQQKNSHVQVSNVHKETKTE